MGETSHSCRYHPSSDVAINETSTVYVSAIDALYVRCDFTGMVRDEIIAWDSALISGSQTTTASGYQISTTPESGELITSEIVVESAALAAYGEGTTPISCSVNGSDVIDYVDVNVLVPGKC